MASLPACHVQQGMNSNSQRQAVSSGSTGEQGVVHFTLGYVIFSRKKVEFLNAA